MESKTTREDLLREIGVESHTSYMEEVLYAQAVAAHSGMNLTDLMCVSVLDANGPMTAGQLAETTSLTTGAITGITNRLERGGYVRREKDPADARRVVIAPVTAALERLEGGWFGSRDPLMEALLSGLDDRELAVLLGFLRKANVLTREGTARLRAQTIGGEGGEFTCSLAQVKRGRLVFANGISHLTLRVADHMHDLYHARFEGPTPNVTVDDGVVTFRHRKRLRGMFCSRGQSGEVTLNGTVPWEIDIRGGAYRIDADLRGAMLSALSLSGGLSDCTVTLPAPCGSVPVRLSGGANAMTIRRPAGTHAELAVRGGVARLAFDDGRFEGLGGKVRLESTGFDPAGDHYAIDISGGANQITIDRVS